MAALIPLEYCPFVASLSASAQPKRFPRLRAGAPIASPALVLAAGFGVGRLCFSTFSASSLSWDCKCSITFLGCFFPFSLAPFTIAFAMLLPSTPKMWQLVRIKLISCLVSGLLPSRKATLMCSSVSSLVLFTTVLADTLFMTLAAAVLRGMTAGSWEGEEGGGEGGGLAWVRWRGELQCGPWFRRG